LNTQYLAIRYTDTLIPGRGGRLGRRVGDSYDNALAESTIGRIKAELITRHGRAHHRAARVRAVRVLVPKATRPPPSWCSTIGGAAVGVRELPNAATSPI
jgi:hypothetical protein